MSWFKSLHAKSKGKTPEQPVRHPTSSAPPAWQPAPEQVHALGLHSDAPDEEYEAGEAFCQRYPPEAPRLLPSEDVERIRQSGCGAWRLVLPTKDPARAECVKLHNGGEPGKMGTILVESSEDCRDICILSDLPLLAGLYDTRGKRGVYYEIKVLRMEGVIAIGTASRPYPHWRLPGWNRLSAGLHLDDGRKFFEDPDGGRTYLPEATQVAPGDTVGVGYEWGRGALFFTHNGGRLPDAFTGVYMPREAHDVFAAIGLAGPGACTLEVNFGAADFEWKEGNEWKVQAHAGMMPGGNNEDDELPSYSNARMDRRVLQM